MKAYRKVNEKVKGLYNHCCTKCSQEGNNVFKVYPKALGGKHTIDNLILLCGSCLKYEITQLQKKYPILVNPEKLREYQQSHMNTNDNCIKPSLNIPKQVKCKNQKNNARAAFVDQESGFILSNHAYKRIKERASRTYTASAALEHCMNVITNGEYIGKTMGDDNKISDVYIYKNEKICIREKEVITYVKDSSSPYEPIKDKLLRTYKAELNRLKKISSSREKYIENLKYESEVEIAEMKLRIHRARTDATKFACQARINAIQISIKEYEDELKEIYRVKSRVVGLVMFAS